MGWDADALNGLLALGVPVDRGVRRRHEASADWGRLVRGSAVAVARPRSADEAASLVRFANDRGLRLTPRATGASSGGQSVAVDSLAVDLTRLDAVGDPADGTVACGPGATWRSVLARVAGGRQAPAMMPLHLDLTVGGVVSIGGGGSTAHRFGVAASTVVELDVVTGAGEQVTCTEGDLFDAVRAGVGRVGLITGLRLALRSAPPMTRATRVAYRDMAVWMDDLWRLADHPDVAQIDSMCHRSPEMAETPWQIDFTVEHDGTAPEVEGLRADVVLGADDLPTAAYCARFDPRFDTMLAVGGTGMAHPWVEALVSRDALAEHLEAVVAMAPGGPQDRLQVIPVRRALLPPNMPAPDGDLVAFVICVPLGVDPSDAGAVGAARRVHETWVEAGGKRLLSGWLPDMDAAAWRRHFGDRYDAWTAAKSAYDPGGVLVSALFPSPEAARTRR